MDKIDRLLADLIESEMPGETFIRDIREHISICGKVTDPMAAYRLTASIFAAAFAPMNQLLPEILQKPLDNLSPLR